MSSKGILNSVNIRSVQDNDKDSILNIYQQGIDTGIATFETEVPTWDQWQCKYRPDSKFVAVNKNGDVVGWIALSSVSVRPVYQGVCETSIYVLPAAAGQGVGKALLNHVMTWASSHGIWTLQANIFPQNQRSITLHESMGFRIVGIRDRIAQRHGSWFDNVLMEYRNPKIY